MPQIETQNPACCAIHDSSVATVFAFGAHHKAGTHLLQVMEHLVVDAMRSTRDGKRNETRPFCPSLDSAAVSLTLAGLVQPQAYRHRCGNLLYFGHAPSLDRMVCQLHFNELEIADTLVIGRGGRDYKLVHVVRDPVAMSVSGYWYHQNTTDIPAGLRPRVLRNLSLDDGLAYNAHWMLPLIRRMVGTAGLLTSDRRRVLTLGYEDFESWRAVAPAVAAFLFDDDDVRGRDAAQAFLSAPSPFKQAGDSYNSREHGPRTSLSQESAAFAAIERSAQRDEIRELNALRVQLGYIPVMGSWVLAPSVLRDASGLLRIPT